MESKLKQSAMDAVGELPAGYLHLPEKFEPEPELTEWFSGDVKPVRDGVFQVESFYYSYWNGEKWSFFSTYIEDLINHDRIKNIDKEFHIKLTWRGLAKDPNQS